MSGSGGATTDAAIALLIDIDRALRSGEWEAAQRLIREGKRIARQLDDDPPAQRQLRTVLSAHRSRLLVGISEAKAAELRHERCADCGASGYRVNLTIETGDPRCRPCRRRWRREQLGERHCTVCRLPLSTTEARNPRRRVCDGCRSGSAERRAASAGLPTLGKRR